MAIKNAKRFALIIRTVLGTKKLDLPDFHRHDRMHNEISDFLRC